MIAESVTIPLAFLGGILSFVSPCVLPLVPSYVSFITGISFEELTDDVGMAEIKKVILFNSIMFILGFSVFFVLILGSSAYLFGSIFIDYMHVIRKVGGVVIVLMGVHIIGVINIDFLHRDKRLHFFREKPSGLIGSFLVGVGFAAGWTPCIGPILSMIFALTTTTEASWSAILFLFIAYSAGLAIPFLLTSVGINSFLKHFARVKRHMRLVSFVTGSLLIATGLLIFFDSFAIISGYFNTFLPAIG